jgi:hypothetical protein
VYLRKYIYGGDVFGVNPTALCEQRMVWSYDYLASTPGPKFN